MTTTPKAIAELKRLLAEATPGPWRVESKSDETLIYEEVIQDGGDGFIADIVLSTCDINTNILLMPHIANSALIAAAVNALPSLLSDLEAAQKREQVLREALRNLAASNLENGHAESGHHLIVAARAALNATEAA
jgi:hypothetical protein